MSVAPCVEYLRVYSAAVVANPHAQTAVHVFNFELEAVRPGMTILVDQGLFADSISLMLEGWLQWLLAAGGHDAKVNIALNRKFLLNAGQSQNHV